ncbi:unnamed protein product [Rotaria sp. Silwood1]|nr:unnamed protein product [Rotaria sp. Silwood1]
MLMKFGEISDSEKLFFLIENKDTTSYTVMMNGYNMNNKPEECLKIFKQMQEKNIVADEITYIIILNACSQIGLLSIYEPIVNKIPSNLLKHHRLQAILIDMWGKVGHVDKALKIFEHIEKPDVMIYTAMINAFGLNGKGHEAIDLYRQMPIDIQNEFTHISVLNACSHSGLISEAQSIFNNIKVKTKRITTVMVDCMSRMFMFDEAQKIIDDFELSHPPGFVMYMALLSAARNHRNSIISEKIYNRMKNLFPQKKQGLIAASVLLSNTYLSIGEDEKAKEIRFKRLSEIGKNKIVGITWTEVNEIYAEITRISTELKENGHQYDSKWITREINDNESIESVLCGHSEKLAIAYNFIQQPIPNIIHATKNLRICGDCRYNCCVDAANSKTILFIKRFDEPIYAGYNGNGRNKSKASYANIDNYLVRSYNSATSSIRMSSDDSIIDELSIIFYSSLTYVHYLMNMYFHLVVVIMYQYVQVLKQGNQY